MTKDRLDVLHIATEQDNAPGSAPVNAQLALVKPCARCPIPNVDPATALTSPEVGDTLQTFRQSALLGGGITFGMNAIVQSGVDQCLRVGQQGQR